MAIYVVRDASGEYISGKGGRTPASDEAEEFDTREEAEGACERSTDRVLVRSDDKKNKTWRVKSKASGSYFGKYATKKAAEADAAAANSTAKYGQDDWEAQEKAGGETSSTDADVEAAIYSSTDALNKLGMLAPASIPVKARKAINEASTKLLEAIRELRVTFESSETDRFEG